MHKRNYKQWFAPREQPHLDTDARNRYFVVVMRRRFMNDSESPKNPVERSVQRKVAERWTPALAEGGWLPVSHFFLDRYAELDVPLSTHEAMVVLHVMRHKWDAGMPWPSAKRLATRMGVSGTAVRNHLRSLVTKGYLKKVPKSGSSNRLDLSPLFTALEELKKKVDLTKPRRVEPFVPQETADR
jgi:DNA-binding MarR family transcriptional regulator